MISGNEDCISLTQRCVWWLDFVNTSMNLWFLKVANFFISLAALSFRRKIRLVIKFLFCCLKVDLL